MSNQAPDAIRAALVESEPATPGVAAGLATQRVETVRTMMKKAGIDPARLLETPHVEGSAGVEEGIKLDLAEPSESPRQPGRRAPSPSGGCSARGRSPRWNEARD